MEHWRELDSVDRGQFLEWLRRETNHRRDKGREKYHKGEDLPMFKGEPLDQAIEEGLDLVFYLWVEKRRQMEASMRTEINPRPDVADQGRYLTDDQLLGLSATSESIDQLRDEFIGPNPDKPLVPERAAWVSPFAIRRVVSEAASNHTEARYAPLEEAAKDVLNEIPPCICVGPYYTGKPHRHDPQCIYHSIGDIEVEALRMSLANLEDWRMSDASTR